MQRQGNEQASHAGMPLGVCSCREHTSAALGLSDTGSFSLSGCPHHGDNEDTKQRWNMETKPVFPFKVVSFSDFGEFFQESTACRCQPGSSSSASLGLLA